MPHVVSEYGLGGTFVHSEADLRYDGLCKLLIIAGEGSLPCLQSNNVW